MAADLSKKKEHDRKRTEWRKTHRALNGKIILYPEKPPEHINARGNKIFNWFWKNILLPTNMHDIPAIISSIKQQIRNEKDKHKIKKLRTMIAMADDAYQLKQIENIETYDGELQLTSSGPYNTGKGIIYQSGGYITTDFSEDEDKIIMRDMDGVIIDVFYGDEIEKNGGK
ncbi:acetyltransferase [Thermoplasmatales archaeon ex4572_165]|nr:MAG: acetyltransferase [Thermoplasmatales archaeon ex4572_165]RLF59950.1 MAG: acetyltransferase [Thermoplasmata archaeon]